MSLYAEYILEREGKLIVEHEDGFATYLIKGDDCYIVDIYVRPAARKSGLASKMADEIADRARALECKFLLGTVNPQTEGATASLKVLLAYGFELAGIGNDGLIWFSQKL